MIDIEKVLKGSPAPNTEKAYKKDISYFWKWAEIALNLQEHYPVSQETIHNFVESHISGFSEETERKMIASGKKQKPGKLKLSTVKRRVDAIIKIHEMEGTPQDFRTAHLKRLYNAGKRLETQQGIITRKPKAITLKTLDKMIKTFKGKQTLKDIRDIAILTFAFHTGGRRNSEVIDAIYNQLSVIPGGYQYNLYRSKTDQTGKGHEKKLHNPDAKHLTAWLKQSGIKDGYLFRQITRKGDIKPDKIGNQVLTQIIKERVEILGLNPVNYSAHSLRHGFITQCGINGTSIFEAMQCTGHKSVDTVYGYYQEGEMINNKASNLRKDPKKKR